AGLVGLLVGASAQGQEALYLRPESFRIDAGAPLKVRLETAKATQAWDNSRVRWLFVRGGGAQENMDAAAGVARQGAAGATRPGWGRGGGPARARGRSGCRIAPRVRGPGLR